MTENKSDLRCRLWEDGHTLFGNQSTEVFLNPSQVKHFVNWLNLNCEKLQNKQFIPHTENELLEMGMSSVNGNTMIKTNRDVFLCNPEDLTRIKEWINLHRKTIGVQEVKS
jgi:hypothetical protein